MSASNLDPIIVKIGALGWSRSRTRLSAVGGQARVMAVDHEDGRKGVLRILKQQDEIACRRFDREIAILIRPEFKHPNIVNILENSQGGELRWYISERGERFDRYWQTERSRLADEPEEMVRLAVGIVKDICRGLAPLHRHGVVHRDIKPKNIVVLDGRRAVVIDFGVAFAAEEERITALDQAVGNYAFSPDVMMNRMEAVPPWIDVFELAQLLIWLVQERATKRWTRPLHWRWVQYDPRLSEHTATRLRAVTAQCAEQDTSPHSAGELLQVLDQLFPDDERAPSSALSVDIASIRRGIAAGRAERDLRLASEYQVLQSSFASLSGIYKELREGLELLYEALKNAGVLTVKINDIDYDRFSSQLLSDSRLSEQREPLFQLDFGEQNGSKFTFRVHAYVFRPSHDEHRNGPALPKTSHLVALYLQRYANLSGPKFPHKTRVLTVERTGELTLRSEKMDPITSQVDIAYVLKMIKEWLEDSEAWEAIQRGY